MPKIAPLSDFKKSENCDRVDMTVIEQFSSLNPITRKVKVLGVTYAVQLICDNLLSE